MSGKVVAIYAAAEAGAELQSLPMAELAAGQGIVGDRYYKQAGSFSAKLKDKADWEATLIEMEEVERFNAAHGCELEPHSFRRNIITRDVRLNELVGRRFAIGGAVLEGVRLCEPCAMLGKLLGPEVVRGTVHKAGIRARIISSATIRPGDQIIEQG